MCSEKYLPINVYLLYFVAAQMKAGNGKIQEGGRKNKKKKFLYLATLLKKTQKTPQK